MMFDAYEKEVLLISRFEEETEIGQGLSSVFGFSRIETDIFGIVGQLSNL
jgi:hypothetical protein